MRFLPTPALIRRLAALPASVRRPALIALIALVAAPMTAAAGERLLPGILGTDDRVVVDSVEWPWAAIGRVNRAGGGFCTGTLIASRLVLTAGHCVFDRAGRRLPPSTVHFVGGYRRGTAATHARARRIIVSDGFEPRAVASVERIANDWALIVLATPIATAPLPIRTLPVEPDRASDAEGTGGGPAPSLMTAGYAQDRPHLLSLHAGCAISARVADDRVILHTCDGTRGSSGSPLLVDGPDGLHVIGVFAGTLQTERIEQSFAVHAHAFMEALGKVMMDGDTR
jgi:protease YdgD